MNVHVSIMDENDIDDVLEISNLSFSSHGADYHMNKN